MPGQTATGSHRTVQLAGRIAFVDVLPERMTATTAKAMSKLQTLNPKPGACGLLGVHNGYVHNLLRQQTGCSMSQLYTMTNG